MATDGDARRSEPPRDVLDRLGISTLPKHVSLLADTDAHKTPYFLASTKMLCATEGGRRQACSRRGLGTTLEQKYEDIVGKLRRAYAAAGRDFDAEHAEFVKQTETADAALPTTRTALDKADDGPPPRGRAKRVVWVQKYTSDGAELLDAYDGPTAAARGIPGATPENVIKAAERRTVYNGFRWFVVNDASSSRVRHDIGRTAEGGGRYSGRVAVMSADGAAVAAVHANAKAACAALGVQPAVMSRELKKDAGKFRRFDDLPPEMKGSATDDAGERTGAIRQIDVATGAVVRRFATRTEASKVLVASRATINRALADPSVLVGGFRLAMD